MDVIIKEKENEKYLDANLYNRELYYFSKYITNRKKKILTEINLVIN